MRSANLLALLLLTVACDEVKETGGTDNSHGLITGLLLTFTPEGGGEALSFGFSDADSGADGLPLGLSNTITTLDWGSGELTVTLLHLAPQNGEPIKIAGLAEDVGSGGFSSISGHNDIQVTFNIEIE